MQIMFSVDSTTQMADFRLLIQNNNNNVYHNLVRPLRSITWLILQCLRCSLITDVKC